eukprot:tig00001029_g6431.t1
MDEAGGDNDSDVEYHDDDFEWEELASRVAESVARQPQLADASTRGRLEAEAASQWDSFYNRNEAKFFKDRRYLLAAFPEELDPSRRPPDSAPLRLLECGCGAGNTLFSLLRRDRRMEAVAFDYSARAVQLVTESPFFDPLRCSAFTWDIEREALPGELVGEGSVDVATLVFSLSAMAPQNMPAVLRRIRAALRPGGLVLFRDYGLYDLSQLRFKPTAKLGESYYARGDGTRSFFFTKEQARALFEGREDWQRAEGGGGEPPEDRPFECLDVRYSTVRNYNRKKRVSMERVWVSGKFRRR